MQRVIALKMAGDSQWVEDFLMACGPRLKGALVRKFRGILNEQDIEDVIGDFAVEMCAVQDGFNPKMGRLKPFCYRRMCWIAVRKIVDMHGLPLLRDIPLEELEEVADCDAVDISPAQAERIAILQEAIGALSPREQEVVRSCMEYGDSLSLKEIAERLNMTSDELYVIRNHVKDKIKGFFKRRGYNPDTLEKLT
jgi:RNA polymerase sigma factor (sigma-70 family)